MSWGERSCLRPCRCPDKCDYFTCNVDCPKYVWDGITKPDSVSIKTINNHKNVITPPDPQHQFPSQGGRFTLSKKEFPHLNRAQRRARK